MKKISHESPLCLLEKSREYNDYDYCLVHLLDQHPQYYNFFVESLRQKREVILDNSIFELGVAFDSKKFAYWIEKLQPTYYIIPDVLENADRTVIQFENWIKNYRDLPGKKIGVVQGKDLDEIIYCYRVIEDDCDKIAISFDYSLYRRLFPHSNEIVSWSIGRVLMINKLLTMGVINVNKPHHLLGVASIEEYKFYKTPEYDFIESVDTSNPIVFGILNMKYTTKNQFLKPRTKLVDFLEIQLSKSQRELIFSNIQYFRKSING